jgi:hypothetical protein
LAGDGPARVSLGDEPFLGVEEISPAARDLLPEPAPKGVVGIAGDERIGPVAHLAEAVLEIVDVLRDRPGIVFLDEAAVGVVAERDSAVGSRQSGCPFVCPLFVGQRFLFRFSEHSQPVNGDAPQHDCDSGNNHRPTEK